MRLTQKYLRIILSALAFITFVSFSGCLKKDSAGAGILEGAISIGPLCPVETVPPDSTCLPTLETYLAYPVGVFTSDGSGKIADIVPSPDGSYAVQLYPGTYSVRLTKEIDAPASSNLPADVEIQANGITLLNINIDTGIR